jgi:serine/threonine protein kinase
MDLPSLSDSVYIVKSTPTSTIESDLDKSIASLSSLAIIAENTKVVYDEASELFYPTCGSYTPYIPNLVLRTVRKAQGITYDNTHEGLVVVMNLLYARVNNCVSYIFNSTLSGNYVPNEFAGFLERVEQKTVRLEAELFNAEQGLLRLMSTYFKNKTDYLNLVKDVDAFFKIGYMSLLKCSVIYKNPYMKEVHYANAIKQMTDNIKVLTEYKRKLPIQDTQNPALDYHATKIVAYIERNLSTWMDYVQTNAKNLHIKRTCEIFWSILVFSKYEIYIFLRVPVVDPDDEKDQEGAFKMPKYVLNYGNGEVCVKQAPRTSMNPIKCNDLLKKNPKLTQDRIEAIYKKENIFLCTEAEHLKDCQGLQGIPTVYNTCELLKHGMSKFLIFMKFYKNRSLRTWMIDFFKNEPILQLKVFYYVILSVFNMHARGYIHQDIKRENVFIDADWTAVIGDWGFSERATSDTSKNVRGSHYYIAPEKLVLLISNKTVALDEKACDIWSLGIVLWEILGNTMPWMQAKTLGDLASTIDNNFKTQSIKENPTVLERYVLRFLRYEPSERIRSECMLEEFEVALDRSFPPQTKKNIGFVKQLKSG